MVELVIIGGGPAGLAARGSMACAIF